MIICLLWNISASANPKSTPPPFQKRGDEVEADYKRYTARLEKDYRALRALLKKEAPDLVKKLRPTPPKPVAYGYQILPKIVGTEPEAEPEPGPAISNSYSWPRTRDFLVREAPRLEELEEKIKAIPKLEPKDRRPVLEKMTDEFPTLEENQKTIDSHVQYNRFWQKAITEDRSRFDFLTKMHAAVMEREGLRENLKKQDDPRLREREAEISRIVVEATHGRMTPSPFLKKRRTRPGLWIVQVPVYTDITDGRFLESFKQAVEKRWHVEKDGAEYRLEILLRRVSPAKLFGEGKVPRKGTHLDVYEHAARFPKDGAVLTTGANSTFAIPHRFVALGPSDLGENVMAHEFGHILGFIDGYFRGYRDLGEDGFEVLEVVPDPVDIMCTPGGGRVHAYHFEKMIGPVTSDAPELGPPSPGSSKPTPGRKTRSKTAPRPGAPPRPEALQPQ